MALKNTTYSKLLHFGSIFQLAAQVQKNFEHIHVARKIHNYLKLELKHLES